MGRQLSARGAGPSQALAMQAAAQALLTAMDAAPAPTPSARLPPPPAANGALPGQPQPQAGDAPKPGETGAAAAAAAAATGAAGKPRPGNSGGGGGGGGGIAKVMDSELEQLRQQGRITQVRRSSACAQHALMRDALFTCGSGGARASKPRPASRAGLCAYVDGGQICVCGDTPATGRVESLAAQRHAGQAGKSRPPPLTQTARVRARVVCVARARAQEEFAALLGFLNAHRLLPTTKRDAAHAPPPALAATRAAALAFFFQAIKPHNCDLQVRSHGAGDAGAMDRRHAHQPPASGLQLPARAPRADGASARGP